MTGRARDDAAVRLMVRAASPAELRRAKLNFADAATGPVFPIAGDMRKQHCQNVQPFIWHIMKLRTLVSSIILASLFAGTASADSDKGRHWHDRHRGEERHHRHHDRRDHDRDHDRHDHRDRDRDRRHGWVNGCPPGLAKKGYKCIPPGHARRHRHVRVGDRFEPRYYSRVSDLDRYNLERRRNWNYYQDQDRIYRVDNTSQKVLGVLSLMQAFAK